MSELPYKPEGIEIKYVGMENFFMSHAKKVAEHFSLDDQHKTGAVIVNPEEIFTGGHAIVSVGANGSRHHIEHGCERKRLKCKTGEGYELCEGCSPVNHAEQTAIRNAEFMCKRTNGSVLYLFGHWWCCESCCDAMKAAGIKTVYLEEKIVDSSKTA